MANKLPTEKKVTVISLLAEGASIRSIERMTGVNRNTIMSLSLRVGAACENIMDTKMVNLPCRNIEVDEIWGFINKKQKNVKSRDSRTLGDVWTWIALDADTNGTKRLDTPLGQAVFQAQFPTCRHTSNPGNGARVGVYAQDFAFLSLLRAF